MALLIFLCHSCSNTIELETVQFNVSAPQVRVQAGDTVQFNFTGTPEMITFFSGEEGNDYQYSQQPRIEGIDRLNLSFETHNQQANGATFNVMVSTDFNGTYTYEHVKSAHWTDITDRFTMAASAAFPQGWQPSGLVDIKDLTVQGSPLYVAFRYVLPPYSGPAAPLRRWWRIQLFSLTSETSANETNVLANYAGAQWKLVRRNANDASAAQITSTIFLFGPVIGSMNEETMEQWGITKAFPTDDINKGTDFGTPIKSLIDAELTTFSHVYQEPGEYEAVFIASNANIAGLSQEIRRVRVTIE